MSPETAHHLHTVCWIDIPVKDLDRACAFYAAVLGEPLERRVRRGTEMGILPHAEGVAGSLFVSGDNEPGRAGPLVYLNVEGRLEEALHEVKTRGGEVLQAKHSIEPYGFRAIALDSEGNRVALHSLAG